MELSSQVEGPLPAKLIVEWEEIQDYPDWGDVGSGYIVQCPKHQEQVAFMWQCG